MKYERVKNNTRLVRVVTEIPADSDVTPLVELSRADGVTASNVNYVLVRAWLDGDLSGTAPALLTGDHEDRVVATLDPQGLPVTVTTGQVASVEWTAGIPLMRLKASENQAAARSVVLLLWQFE